MIREEIAQAAARLIAEEGLSYEAAKKKAYRQLLGNQRINGDFLPANSEVEAEVKIYQSLFMSETQPLRLLSLREKARSLMEMLKDFNPYVIGAVFNGTAGEYSDIHLELFTDNAKDVEIFLLNKRKDIDVEEAPAGSKRAQPVEIIHFEDQGEAVHLMVHNTDDLRKMPQGEGKTKQRATILQLNDLIQEQQKELRNSSDKTDNI